MLQVSPHVLVKWRPDIEQYNAYMIRQAPKGAKADPTARMLLLPDMRMYEDVDQREFIATAQHRLVEDPTEIAIACPLAADTVLERSAWAITAKGPAWNVTGPTNTMQAADCGAGCGWTGEKTMNITTQVGKQQRLQVAGVPQQAACVLSQGIQVELRMTCADALVHVHAAVCTEPLRLCTHHVADSCWLLAAAGCGADGGVRPPGGVDR